MTQVPPTRCSSAIITLAPCSAATRAARTPPEPAPITNKSTSSLIPSPGASAVRLEIVALLLHLRAHAVHHLFGELIGPLLDPAEAVVENPGFLLDDLPSERGAVEGERVLEL